MLKLRGTLGRTMLARAHPLRAGLLRYGKHRLECDAIDDKRFAGIKAMVLKRPARLACAAGFTLIEIMVVVVILGILAALVVPRVMNRPDEARVTAARQDIAALSQALQLYKLDQGRYPSTEQGLEALVRKPTRGTVPPQWKPVLDRLPRDGWGNPYQYLNPGLHGEIDVFSFGADGAPGGEGNDADIGSWNLQ